MIHGTIVGLQAEVRVTLILPDRRSVEITCVVDTGFAGALTLPLGAIEKLSLLPFVIQMNANLADDSNVMTPIHRATIVWHGVEQDIAVAMGRRPLLGTALLENSNLNIDFYEGGTVIVDEL